jgi:Tfp pilus assembly PilM family ATPase
MNRAWSGWRPALGGIGAACGIEVTEHLLRAVACDAAGRCIASTDVPVEAAGDRTWLEAFRLLRARAPGLPRRVVCSPPPGWADVLPLRLPAGGDLEALLVERARQHLSYPVEDAVLDYLDPEPRTDGTRRALLVAVPRARVMALMQDAAAAGFRIQALETAGAALQRAVDRCGRLDARRTLIVHLDAAHALFLVADARHLHVERVLPWGTRRLAALAAERLEMPETAAARLLYGAAAPPDGEPMLAEVRAALAEILAPVLRELALEVERVLGYCRAEFRDAGFERLLLSGGAGGSWCVRAAVQDIGAEVEDAFGGGRTQPPPGIEVAHGLALRAREAACGR